MQKIDPEFVASYARKRAPWGFSGLGEIVYLRTYSRFIDELGRKEQWHETLERAINGAQEIGAEYTQTEMQRLFDYMFNLKGSFSGRALWQLGTPLVQQFSGASVNNCFYTNIETIDDFAFLMDHLMLGGGVGFSVERAKIHSFPKVKANVRIGHERTNDADFIVPDSRQGWSALLRKVLRSYFYTNESFTYSTILVRSFGAPLKTFGGTASGPEILIEGIGDICRILNKRAGKKMRSIDALDVANVIGKIVVAGSARRSAQISVGDPDDFLFLRAKNWGNGTIPAYRSSSNNSIYADSYDEIVDELWKGYTGNGEPYGLINRALASTQGRLGELIDDGKIAGPNPCVTGDTWVHTEYGPRQVIDLIGQQTNVYVNGVIYETTDLGFFETGIKPVFELNTTEGYSLKLTNDHRISTERGWVAAGELVQGDKVNLHQHNDITLWTGSGNFDDGYLVGHYIGSGIFTRKDSGNVLAGNIRLRSFGNEDGERGVRNYLEKIAFGLPSYGGFNGWDEQSHSYWDEQFQSYELRTNGITRQIETYFGGHPNKSITPNMHRASSAFQEGLLAALFDTHGHIQRTSIEENCSIQLYGFNESFLQNIQKMLLRFGIRSTIQEVHEANYHLIISTDCTQFMNHIGFMNSDKTYKYHQLKKDTGGLDLQPWTGTFSELVAVGEEKVYDVQVPGANCFDANGIVAHNCAEILLEDGENCNLGDLYLPNIESQEELQDLSILIYKTQKAITSLDYPYKKTQDVVRRNRRLGQGITGWMQATEEQISWVAPTYEKLREFDIEWSARHNIPISIKLTTTKPSGTLSLLAGTTPGIHPAYARHYIRRVRIGAADPIVDYCRLRGYPIQYDVGLDGLEDHRTVVVTFPCESPKNALLVKDTTAIKQLEWVVKAQTLWADNAVSVTVYYKKEEIPEIQEWLKANYETKIKSVSFLLHSEHGFTLAPYEEISEEEFHKMVNRIKEIDLDQATLQDESLATLDVECDSGGCPVR